MNKDPLLRWYIEHGICIGCRKESAMPGKQKCPECLYKQTIANIKYRSLEYERGRYAKRKEQRSERIAHKLCPNCGKPAKHGQLCSECYIKKQRVHQRGREQRLQRGDPRRIRVENGLCWLCDSPAMEGKKVCEKHFAELMERKGFGDGGRRDNHPWERDETARLTRIKRSPLK